ncbi:DUF3289 family protein [Vibrio sp. M260112]|uniref:DUF3289 family protein n=1 Tax=Vibrio sp. M260112 TaxID=3020895 RepID=UPI002F3FD5CC
MNGTFGVSINNSFLFHPLWRVSFHFLLREKIERQRKERIKQSEETWAYVQANQSRYAAQRAETLAKREANEKWKPVEGNFPLLVFETQNKMDDFDASDMTFGDESKETIEQYGLMKPFKQSEYYSHREGYTLYGKDQFSLPPSEHFKRMRSLGDLFSNSKIGSLMGFETSSIFSDMVDKFERNEGGYYSNPLLTNALKDHETTANFHKALKKCLEENLKNGKLPDDIVSVSSKYMMSSKGKPLPQFLVGDISKLDPHPNLADGTVLSVHGIWSMQVYIESLEYKANQIRGKFRYEVQDHFGLDVKDIDHDPFDNIEENDGKPYEWLEGFRSWYLLQHYRMYGFKPFIAKMTFEL